MYEGGSAPNSIKEHWNDTPDNDVDITTYEEFSIVINRIGWEYTFSKQPKVKQRIVEQVADFLRDVQTLHGEIEREEGSEVADKVARYLATLCLGEMNKIIPLTDPMLAQPVEFQGEMYPSVVETADSLGFKRNIDMADLYAFFENNIIFPHAWVAENHARWVGAGLAVVDYKALEVMIAFMIDNGLLARPDGVYSDEARVKALVEKDETHLKAMITALTLTHLTEKGKRVAVYSLDELCAYLKAPENFPADNPNAAMLEAVTSQLLLEHNVEMRERVLAIIEGEQQEKLFNAASHITFTITDIPNLAERDALVARVLNWEEGEMPTRYRPNIMELQNIFKGDRQPDGTHAIRSEVDLEGFEAIRMALVVKGTGMHGWLHSKNTVGISTDVTCTQFAQQFYDAFTSPDMQERASYKAAQSNYQQRIAERQQERKR